VIARAKAVTQTLPPLDPLEVSSGLAFGPRREPPTEADPQPSAPPAETLEEILLEALQQPPLVVAFSGGRDSSAILAKATQVARANGFEDPIPLTLRFPGASRTSEEHWQELIIRHLGLENWSRRRVDDELDALGPIATEVLRRYGVHWPPNAHILKLLLDPAAGGSLLTGNGGDELFLPWPGHRIALLRHGRTLPRWSDIRPFVRSLVPSAALVRRSLNRGYFRLPWLTPAASRQVERSFAELVAQREGSWAEALEDHLNSRFLELGHAIAGAMAEDADVVLVEPFFDPRYVRAVYADAPREGFASRSLAMVRHFGDLLPPVVAARASKAVFTEVFCGPEMRIFAERWSGAGLDSSLIKPEALRHEWLAPIPDVRSLVAIQAAWLASERPS
jgi:asparagine synthetase B (glutamine-hydrolysing)